MSALRAWLSSRGETLVYYFLTEVVKGDIPDYEFRLDELYSEILRKVNVGAENVLAGKNFDWAIFIDHAGCVHAAGPADLQDLVKTFGITSTS